MKILQYTTRLLNGEDKKRSWSKNKSKYGVNAKKDLEKTAKKIEKELISILNKEVNTAFGANAEQKKLSKTILSHIKEHNLRTAKRLRASLIYYGFKLQSNGRVRENEIQRAAASIELIHTGLLMFDDFMDQDKMRRGLPTTHMFFKNLHKDWNLKGDSLHFGESMAVNTGLAAICIGYKVLGQANFEDSAKVSALNQCFEGIKKTALGQSYDLLLEGKGKTNQEDVIALHYAKTAVYTYETPLFIGASLAGANEKDLKLISEYAIPAGIAFQIQDDILGLYGDPKKTGKSAFSDLRQGKPNLLILDSLKKADKKQKQKINKYWGNVKTKDKDAEEVREIVTETGSLENSKRVSVEWAKKAQESVKKMEKRGWNKASLDYLYGVAQYMVEREY